MAPNYICLEEEQNSTPQKGETLPCYLMKTYSATATAFKHVWREGVPKDQPPKFWQLKQRLEGKERERPVSIHEGWTHGNLTPPCHSFTRQPFC